MSRAPADLHERMQPPLQRAALIDLNLDMLAALLQLPEGVRISHLVPTPDEHRCLLLAVTGAGPLLAVTGAGPLLASGMAMPRFKGWCHLQRDAEGVEHLRATWPGLFTDELATEGSA